MAEEEKLQADPVLNLPFDATRDELQKIVEEKSRLIMIWSSKDQIKTFCFQPNTGKIKQGIETCSFKSQTIKENDGLIRKFDRETRTRFENTSSYPHSVHGLVRVNIINQVYKTGTGILIGPNLVLTAAHNIYDHMNTKKKYSNIEFIPGINETIMPFGIFKVVESYAPDEFEKTCDKEDYALLVLDGTPGVNAGYFGLDVAEKNLLQGKELNVIGYPGYVRTKDERNELKILSSEGHHQLWGTKGKFWFEDDRDNGEFLINYDDILTTAGQSGSGVFYHVERTNEYYVIGVHVLGREDSYNSATWITKERFDQIKSWIGQSRKNIRKIPKRKKKEGKTMIKKLNLNQMKIGKVGVEALSEIEYALKDLNLAGNGLGVEGAKVLSKNNSWINLTTLNLAENYLGVEGAKVLSNNNSWINLTTLNLAENDLRVEGAKVLSKNSSWINLATLNLADNYLCSEGAEALSKNSTWINLTTLDLSKNFIRCEGAEALSKNNSWANFKTLKVPKKEIGYIGEEILLKRWPILNLLCNDPMLESDYVDF